MHCVWRRYWPCLWTLDKQPSVGVRHDGGKWICGMHELGASLRQRPRPCVIYSFGSENKFHFEAQVGTHARCEVHTFDPTVLPAYSPHYSHFHSLGLGGARAHLSAVGPLWPLADILTALEHTSLELLKVDVEGAEFDALAAIDWSALPCRIGQLLLEVHPCRAMGAPPCRGVVAVQRMFSRLERAGFRLFSLEPVTKTDYSQVEVSWVHRDWTPSGWRGEGA